ncbi:MAG: hypothetical protein RR704_07400 [Stenotrophomonas sp.]
MLLIACGSASGTPHSSAPAIPAYERVANARLSAGYADTQCWNLQAAQRTLGVYCHSTQRAFLETLGVSVTTAEDAAGTEVHRVDFATGMRAYPGTPHALQRSEGFIAEVDCDPGKNAVYRAKATCMAAVWLDGTTNHYAELILRDETTGRQHLTAAGALSVIASLDRAPPRTVPLPPLRLLAAAPLAGGLR